MKRKVPFEYDPEADAVDITLGSSQRDYSVDLESATEGRPILISIDTDGYLTGFQILDASKVLGPELTRER